MRQAAYLLPPVAIIIALVLQSASGGFVLFSAITAPVFLLIAAIVGAIVISKKVSEEDAIRCGVVNLVWISFGILAGFAWLAARSGGYVSYSDFTSLLGLENVFSSTWLRFLIALSFAFLVGAFLSKKRKNATYVAIAFAFLGFLAIFIDFSFGWKALINVMPGQEISLVSKQDGMLERLPFKLKVIDYAQDIDNNAFRLKIEDQKGNTTGVRELFGGKEVSLPGTDSKLVMQRETIKASIKRLAEKESIEYKAPMLQVVEKDASTGEITGNHILYGSGGATDAAFIVGRQMKLFFRFYGEQKDYDELFRSNLPYIPEVEARFSEISRPYSIPVVNGKKIVIPGTHYSVTVISSFLGDNITGEEGKVELEVQGPKGKETFKLSESCIQLRGNKYNHLLLKYRHPEVFGESRSFIRVLAADGCATSVSVFENGIKTETNQLSDGFELRNDDSVLVFSEVFPEARIVENLFEDESGHDCPVFLLKREGEEDTRLVISPFQYYPTELFRERLRISVAMVPGSMTNRALLEIDGDDSEEIIISSSGSYTKQNVSVTLLGIDPLQQGHVTIGITRRFFGVWGLVLFFIGLAILAGSKLKENLNECCASDNKSEEEAS